MNWTDWLTVQTPVGDAIYRYRFTSIYNNSESGIFEISFEEEVWNGTMCMRVDDTQSYSVENIYAKYSPYIPLKGDEHAASIEKFVQYALPFLVSNTYPPDDIGQLMDA